MRSRLAIAGLCAVLVLATLVGRSDAVKINNPSVGVVSTGNYQMNSLGVGIAPDNTAGDIKMAQGATLCGPRAPDNALICISLTGSGIHQKLIIDPNSNATWIAFGDGSTGFEAPLLYSPGTSLMWISHDLSEDDIWQSKDASDNFTFGGPQNGATKYGNINITVPTGKTINLQVNNTTVATISGISVSFAQPISLTPIAFASCLGVTNAATGACNQAGALCAITDDNTACAFSATIVNGGAHKVLGYCDGTQYVMTECK